MTPGRSPDGGSAAQMLTVTPPQVSWVSRLPHHAQPASPISQPEIAARGVQFAVDHPDRGVPVGVLDDGTSWVVRLPGGRWMGQGGLLCLRPTDRGLALGRSVDAVLGPDVPEAAAVLADVRRDAGSPDPWRPLPGDPIGTLMGSVEWSSDSPHTLQEYALLADGERGAPVGPRGDISWLCAPSWDSPSVFTSLIGGLGSYDVTPVGRFVWGGHYEPGSLIWRNRWVTDDGIIECRDALAFPGAPGRVVVLRRIIAVKGTARVRVGLEARGGYRADPFSEFHRSGAHGQLAVARSSFVGRARRPPEPAQEEPTVICPWSSRWPPANITISSWKSPTARSLLNRSTPRWRGAPRRSPGTGPSRHSMSASAPSDARRNYAVLRGLTTSSGGMVAAATTSLPERSEAGRNYDYRYVLDPRSVLCRPRHGRHRRLAPFG